MAKPQTGYVGWDKQKKKYFARVDYSDEAGKRRNVRRFFTMKSDAIDALPTLVSTIKQHGAQSLKGELLTVAALIERYEEAYVRPAEIHQGRKVDGLKSWRSVQLHCRVLKEYFGSKQLRELRPSHLEAFKRHRLKTPKQLGGGIRTQAAVHRELQALRAILNYAKREGWIIASPFEKARGIISQASETRRNRVLSQMEEQKLLAACTGKREHLRAILIFCLDTGGRRGEVFQVRWADVDFARREITLQIVTTKTEQARRVPVTARLLDELQRLQTLPTYQPEGFVFGGIKDAKKSFKAACTEAGIDGLRFHDLRHSFVSRMLGQGMATTEVMRLSGHTTLSAFNNYANLLSDATERGAAALDTYHAQFAQANNEFVN